MKRIVMIGICVFLMILAVASFFHNTGPDKISIKKAGDNEFQLLVNNKPYIIKGVVYNPVPIGRTHTYDFWSDPLKPHIRDGKLMKEMGVNTIRAYKAGEDIEAVKGVIKDLYAKFNIRVAMGHWLGFWDNPNHADKDFREKVKKDVLEMVNTYKDEKGILCWILGNENNRSFDYGPEALNVWTNDEIEAIEDPYERRKERAKIYYTFVNDLAKEIKKIDPNHPIVFGNAELSYADEEVASKVTPDIDILGCSIYRGKTLGSFFRKCNISFKRPSLLIEFGCDRYNAYLKKEDQDIQAEFLKAQWEEIEKNTYKGNGCKNSIGGFVFEWTDEWWKHHEDNKAGWDVHDTESSWSNGSYYFDIKAERNFNINEEWWGVVALEKSSQGLDERRPTKAYFTLKELWR
ncbi:MAG: hypothetical protein ABH848_01530 [Candidatus Omnitrophota bacterium]